MKKMPSRDTSGKCRGECRNRVLEGETERQKAIKKQAYSSPADKSPSWASDRDDPPGSMGGRI
jgi:hypothetical protein